MRIHRSGTAIGLAAVVLAAVVLPATEISGSAALGERLRQTVAGSPMIVDSHLITPTVSIGCAQLAPGEPLVATIARADKALYDAKAQGRNTVIALPA